MSGDRMHPDDDLLRALRRSADAADRRLAALLSPLRPASDAAAPPASPALAAFLADRPATAPAASSTQLVELGPAAPPEPPRRHRRLGARLALGAALAAVTVGVAAAATGALPTRDDSVVVNPSDDQPSGSVSPPVDGDHDDHEGRGHLGTGDDRSAPAQPEQHGRRQVAPAGSPATVPPSAQVGPVLPTSRRGGEDGSGQDDGSEDVSGAGDATGSGSGGDDGDLGDDSGTGSGEVTDDGGSGSTDGGTAPVDGGDG